MKKIIYFMHIDWDWIKQRPHYIAENLSKYYNILIIYPYHIRKSKLTKNNKEGLRLKAILYIPNKKFKKLHVLSTIIIKFYIKIILKIFNPDYIWLTFPALYKLIPSQCKCKIIYDCMDDAGEFDTSDEIKSELLNLEIDLIKKSSVIFVSSKNLMNTINMREYCQHKTVLVRNAFGGNKLDIYSQNKLEVKKNIYKICYVGTVSSWFDFDSLNFCVENIENIEFHIIGPVDVSIEDWLHKRIILHGPINHNKLYMHIKDFDCMIMPFMINKLIMSVDPVKLYEYINYNKPIISIYYKEIERFSKYVSFYSNKEELLNIINNMINTGFIPKYDEKQREKLLKNSSWEIRTNKIRKYLEKTDI